MNESYGKGQKRKNNEEQTLHRFYKIDARN
jgi:hypothetical protein